MLSLPSNLSYMSSLSYPLPPRFDDLKVTERPVQITKILVISTTQFTTLLTFFIQIFPEHFVLL
jgi:hypothetical protein